MEVAFGPVDGRQVGQVQDPGLVAARSLSRLVGSPVHALWNLPGQELHWTCGSQVLMVLGHSGHLVPGGVAYEGATDL